MPARTNAAHHRRITMDRLPRPTANHYAGDPRPDLTALAILRKLDEIRRPSDRRELVTLIYGTDKVGGARIAGAVGGLRTKRLVDTLPGGKYRRVRINDAGRAALRLADELAAGDRSLANFIADDDVELPPCAAEAST